MGDDGEAVRSSTAAQLLRVKSRQTINNWIKDGLLRYTVTAGGQHRIERASIDELAAVLAVKDRGEREAAMEELRRKNRGET